MLTGNNDESDDGVAGVTAAGQSAAGQEQSAAAATATNGAQALYDSFQARIAADPGDRDAWTSLGALLLTNGQYAAAADAFAGALEIDPNHGPSRADLGAALLYQGMLRLARVELRRAIELDPTILEAHINMGITYSHATPPDPSAARKEWQTVIDLAPDSELAAQAQRYLDSANNETATAGSTPTTP
jgi:cytochrome c-type biogenesis protein CcmH/NrfG